MLERIPCRSCRESSWNVSTKCGSRNLSFKDRLRRPITFMPFQSSFYLGARSQVPERLFNIMCGFCCNIAIFSVQLRFERLFCITNHGTRYLKHIPEWWYALKWLVVFLYVWRSLKLYGSHHKYCFPFYTIIAFLISFWYVLFNYMSRFLWWRLSNCKVFHNPHPCLRNMSKLLIFLSKR